MGKVELPSWLWITVSVIGVLLLGLVDWASGYELSFFVFYILPISATAWFVGRGIWAFIAVICAVVWLAADVSSGHVHSMHFYAVWNTGIRLIAFLLFGWFVSKVHRLLKSERQLVDEQRRLLSQIKVLEAFLAICAQCKKIRKPDGQWQQLESYILEHAGTQFSHGYCPECARKAMETVKP